MADGTKLIDEGTTLALIQAFGQASQDQDAAHRSVSGTAASLAGGWTGTASGTYGNGLSAWMNGLIKVHNALQLIDDAMVTFAKDTANTEDDNIALAGYSLTNASWT